MSKVAINENNCSLHIRIRHERGDFRFSYGNIAKLVKHYDHRCRGRERADKFDCVNKGARYTEHNYETDIDGAALDHDLLVLEEQNNTATLNFYRLPIGDRPNFSLPLEMSVARVYCCGTGPENPARYCAEGNRIRRTIGLRANAGEIVLPSGNSS